MKYLFYILLLLPFLSLSQGNILLYDINIKAFPTADGHGRFATGGRADNVYRVTNLNDAGSGSLRQALTDADTNGGGNIIFTTGGTIELSSRITISTSDNITIAGQSASGDGIALHNYGIRIKESSNIIIRHIRIRPGDDIISTGQDAFDIGTDLSDITMTNFMLDHCSFSWGDDENISVTGEEFSNTYLGDITFQNCIISEPFRNGYGMLVSYGVSNVSIIKNLFSHVRDRSPATSVPDVEFEFINNIVYDGNGGTNSVVLNKHSIIGNLYKDVPALWDIAMSECIGNCDPDVTSNSGGLWFEDDNYTDGIRSTVNSRYNGAAEQGSRVLASNYTPVLHTAVDALLLTNLGARANMSDGNDALDAEMITDYENGVGTRPTTESGTSGLPTLAAGTAYTDTDSDGLSDTYETDQGGTTTSISNSVRPATAVIADGRTIDQTNVTSYATLGYTHLDIFLADMAGDWDGFETVPTTEGGRITSSNIRPKAALYGANGKVN